MHDPEESLLRKAERAASNSAGAQTPPVASEPAHLQVSLHGEHAARRQAITELLFFASVGDLPRCKKLCRTWSIQVGLLRLA